MLSYIEDNEIEEAKAFIAKQFDFELPYLLHDNVLVKLYIRPEEISTVLTSDGRAVTLYWPEYVRAEDKFKSCAALVVDISTSFLKRKIKLNYRIGDFLLIPRNEGVQINYCGHIFHILDGKRIFSILQDPSSIKRM